MKVFLVCPVCQIRVAGCQRRLSLKASACIDCKDETCPAKKRGMNFHIQLSICYPCPHCKEEEEDGL